MSGVENFFVTYKKVEDIYIYFFFFFFVIVGKKTIRCNMVGDADMIIEAL